MKLDNLISIISNYANSYISGGKDEDKTGDIADDENIFASDKGEKIVTGLFSVCDKDGNGDLSSEELTSLIQKLESYSEFSGISFEGIDDFSDDFDLGDDLFEDSDIEDDTVSKYQDSNNMLEYLLLSDESVDIKLLSDRSKVLEDLQANYELINTLEEKTDLTAEEKEQLEKYIAEREELLKKRDEIEAQILENSSDETKNALKDMQGLRGSLDDKQLETSKSLDSLREKIGIKTDTDKDKKVSESGGSSGSGGVGGVGGGSVGGVGGQTTVPNTGGDSTDETVASSELEQELINKQTELETKEGELSAVLNGSNSELVELKNLENEAFANYKDKLSTIDEQLANNLETKKADIETKNQEIAEKEIAISESKGNITEIQLNIDSISSNIASCEKTVSSLEQQSQSSELSDEEKSSISVTIQGIKDTIEELNNQEAELETTLASEKENLSNLEGELVTLNDELQVLNSEMSTIEGEIALLEDGELQNLKEQYETSKTTYTEKQNELRTQLEGEIAQLKNEIQILQTKVDEETNIQIEALAGISEERDSYTLGDETYDTVIGSEELQGVASEIAQGKDEGTEDEASGGKDDLSYALETNDKFFGSSTESEDEEGEADSESEAYVYFDETDQENILAEVQKQLISGKPALMKVDSDSGECYVSVVGVRQGIGLATEKDLLVVDISDGTIKNLGDILPENTDEEERENQEYTLGLYIKK